jgi:hypothetical protein
MFWRMYPKLVQMDKFRTGEIEVPTYSDPPQNYYRESPLWEWKEDLRRTASPELGERAIGLIVDHLAAAVKEKIEKLGTDPHVSMK